jgi:hypothetical protein
MAFYVVHKLKVKNPNSLTQEQNSESNKLYRTTKALLFHRIAADFREQDIKNVAIGDLVSDSESNKDHWLLGFDIRSTPEKESQIFQYLDWIDSQIVAVLSGLRDVVFEPRLSAIPETKENSNVSLDKAIVDHLTKQVQQFIYDHLAGHNSIDLSRFSGLGEKVGLTIHRAEQLSGQLDSTKIYKFIGRVTSYDPTQKTIKAFRSENTDPQMQNIEGHTDDNPSAVIDSLGSLNEMHPNETSDVKAPSIRKLKEETFHINTNDFISVEHQAKYMPWERRFNKEIEFSYQILDDRKQICLRYDELHKKEQR